MDLDARAPRHDFIHVSVETVSGFSGCRWNHCPPFVMNAIDTYGDQHDLRTFIRRVNSVEDPILRIRQVRRHFVTVDPAIVAEHLEAVLLNTVRGSVTAMAVAMSIAEFLLRAVDDSQATLAVENVNIAAHGAGCVASGWMLLDPLPFRRVGDRRVAPSTSSGAQVPLGVRKARATNWNRQHLESLLSDSHPHVIDRLCDNPKISEQHIMAIVTRRPTAPAVLDVVANHVKWIRRRSIRFALACNPYANTRVALCFLPLMNGAERARIRNAGDLHPTIADAARFYGELGESDRGRG